MAYSNSLIDKRVVDRNIAKGLVDPEQLKTQIEALPDVESNCVNVSLDGDARVARMASAEDDALDSGDEDLDDIDDDDDESDDEG